MKKLLLPIVSMLVLSLNAQAQLGVYQFSHTNGNSCSSPSLSVTSQPANATFSNFSRNTVTCNPEANVFNNKSWTTSSSINTSQYVEFSVTANSGYAVTLTSISFKSKRNNHGPTEGRVAHNFSGNFTTDYHNFDTDDSEATTTWNFTDFSTAGGATVTFRIYGWDAGNASSGTFYVDDVTLNGSVIVAPTPPAANAGSTISSCTGTSALTMSGATATGTYSVVAWSGGSGSGTWSGSGTNPATYQFTPSTASGSFTATLTVTGSGIYTGTNPTSTRTISWGTTPTAVSGSAISSCTGTSVLNVSDASAGGTYSAVSWAYTPSSGTGSITGGSSSLTPAFTPSSASGNGTLTLTVTGSGACAGTNPTSVKSVSWGTTPTANGGSAISSCIAGGNISVSGATAGGTYSGVSWAYTPSSGTGNISSGSSTLTPAFTPSSASGSGVLTITVNGSGACAGTNPTAVKNISWDTAPTANAGAAIVSCASMSDINVTGATAGGSYSGVSWAYTPSTGSGDISVGGTSLTPTFTPSSVAGNGSLLLTVTGSGACVGTNPTSSKSITWATPGTWTGGTDNNWFNASNWCTLPDENTNATILAGTAFTPNVNTDGAVCRNLTINTGAAVNINAAGRIHIKGRLTNNGSANLGTGTVEFDGSMPQSIYGDNNFSNLEIDNSMMVSVMTGSQTVSGVVTLTQGILYTYGNPFTLLSTPSATAQISGEGDGDIEGLLTVQRFVPAAPFSANPFNHLIASPLRTDTLVDTGLSGFADDFTLVANGYGSTPVGTFFQFMEHATGAAGSPFSYDCLKAPTQIVNMHGYAAQINGATTLDITGTYKHNVAPIRNLSYTPGSGGNGWNLVGNPYPSTLDWNANTSWVKNYISNSIYIWNPAIQQYTSYNGTVGTNGGTQFIAPMQSFFVVATDENPMISALNSARVTTVASFFKADEVSELIRLKVTGSNGVQDETLVYFDINASQELDAFDSYKITSIVPGVPMLASRLGDVNISINVLPGHNTETVIPMNFNAPAGNYSFSANELLGFGNGNPAYLQDALTGNIVEITENFQYDFTASENDEYRFSIVFDAPMITGVDEAATKAVKFYNSSQQLMIEAAGLTENTSILSMYNTSGQVIIPGQQIQFNNGRYSMNLPNVAAGIYIFKLQNGNDEFNHKLYINLTPTF